MARLVPGRYTTAGILFVIIVFIVITIACIRYFGHNPVTLPRFPPYISQCPPYWTNHGNGKCSYNPSQPNGKPKCDHNDLRGVNLSSLQYENNSPVDFSNNSLADRCNWSKTCQVYWDGISDQNCGNNEHFNKYTLY